MAFLTFVPWCSFPLEPKDSLSGEQLSTFRYICAIILLLYRAKRLTQWRTVIYSGIVLVGICAMVLLPYRAQRLHKRTVHREIKLKFLKF